jgi:soluble lytic murein transglycosylase-like protein
MKNSRTAAVLSILAGLLAVSPAWSQGVYSYVDGSGVRTLTNIPPSRPVNDLQLSASAILAPPAPPAPAPAPAAGSRPARTTQYDPLIDKYAAQFQVDPSLIRSMIVQESNYNVRAVSRKGARGLMQLMPETAARLGVKNTFDPEENLRGGTQHLRFLLDLFDNDVSLSLAAYNAGENLVSRIRRVPNIAETRDYVKNITARYGSLKHPPRQAAAADTPPPPPMFRYLDGNGILHLTNLPPVERAAASSGDPAGASGGRMP